MKTAGVIVEYNPFHNGHLYHLSRSREITGADYIVAVMSGCFVQRGAPALCDKYMRTEMALSCGADLVLELPVFSASGSAGDFAAGAVALLDKLGVVDFMCFGSECGEIEPFLNTSALLASEPPQFSAVLKEKLRQGLSFPAARAAALKGSLTHIPDDFFSSPNNILGLEYCTALQKRAGGIRPVTILRSGGGYSETDLLETSFFPSALAIRRALQDSFAQSPGSSRTDGAELEWERIAPFIPSVLMPLWNRIFTEGRLLFTADFSRELRCRLLTEDSGYEKFADVTRGLADKITRNRFRFTDWDELCVSLKTKELTYSRISRALCHILLSITADELLAFRENDYTPYARILGLKKEASPLLSAIRKNAGIPLVSKLADARRLLTPGALSVLNKDILAAHLYEGVMAARTGQPPANEYTRRIVIR